MTPRLGDLAADALRYWEPRRIVYNVVLLAVVCAHFYAVWPISQALLRWDLLFVFVGLAVLANIAYCAAYVVDLFVQFSGLRSEWARWRWVVMLAGTAFAAVVAHFLTLGIIGGGRAN
jgi:hypothetical protein